MKISEYFDPENIDHLKAWNHLSMKGAWPVGFLPDDIEIEPMWAYVVSFKMAKVYVKEKLGEEKEDSKIELTKRQRELMNAFAEEKCVVVGISFFLNDQYEETVAKNLAEKGFLTFHEGGDLWGSISLTQKGVEYMIKEHNLPPNHPWLE